MPLHEGFRREGRLHFGKALPRRPVAVPSHKGPHNFILHQEVGGLGQLHEDQAIASLHGVAEGSRPSLGSIQSCPALLDAGHSHGHPVGGGRLHEVVQGRSLEGLQGMLGMGGHEHHGEGPGQLQGHLQSGSTGHIDIQEGRIRLAATGQPLQHAWAVGELGHHQTSGLLQQPGQPLAVEGFVLRDQDSQGVRHVRPPAGLQPPSEPPPGAGRGGPQGRSGPGAGPGWSGPCPEGQR